jgi:hypothetical protein
MAARCEPFPYEVHRNVVPRSLCRAAEAEVACLLPDNSPDWLLYGGEEGRGHKFVTKDRSRLPPTCQLILQQYLAPCTPAILEEDPTLASSYFPDLTLHGAGLSLILPGGSLPLHLDADHHPNTGWTRVASAMLYLSSCEGGEFVLHDQAPNHATGVIEYPINTQIAPTPGTLIIFRCSDYSWHSVNPVISGQRLSLSLFFWSLPLADSATKRSRSLFRASS